MPRWFFIVVALFGIAAFASYALTLPDPVGLFLAKLGEGGMWTAVAVCVVVSVVIGCLPRGAGRTSRAPRK